MGAQTGREYKEMNTEVCEYCPQSKSEKMWIFVELFYARKSEINGWAHNIHY